MPPKKKGRAANNKKKKVKGRNIGGSGGGGASAARPASADDDAFRNMRNLPTFHTARDRGATASEDSCVGGSGSGGYYKIYKKATTGFCDWMRSALPKLRMRSVNDLRKGADEIMEHNVQTMLEQQKEGRQQQKQDTPPSPIVAPSDVMDELSTCIMYREKLTNTKFGDSGDYGHHYMIETLRYCRSVLKFSRTVARVILIDGAKTQQKDINADTESNDIDGIGGRFKALLLEEGDEDEDMETVENDIRRGNFPTFNAPEPPEEEVDIQKALIDGDDRFQAAALLHTIDDLMGAVDAHYGMLKRFMRGQELHESSSALKLLMECTVAANMATETVQAAENTLAATHPHLSSFYHVLALVFLPTQVAEIKKNIDKTRLEPDPHMALHYVASIIECSFHNAGDQSIPGKVNRFARKSGIPLATLQHKTQQIHFTTSYEVMLSMEEGRNPAISALGQSMGIRPHIWLQQSGYIGGDRCILNTQNIVQKLMDAVQDNTKLVGKPGFWGAEFDEQTNLAAKIRGDLDEPFAASILPELIEICKQAPFKCLPETSQLIPVLDLMHAFVNADRSRPVPIALTFGLHAMLTSIFVLQGNGDLGRVAYYAKQSYMTLFKQLDKLSDPSVPPENAPSFYCNVAMFKNLKKFAEPVVVAQQHDPRLNVRDPAVTERRAFWNPVIGGEYLLYGTYICSIGLGSATVDSLGQLRFSLHLYNALKQCMPSLEVPFLKTIDKVFSNTKAVWVGGRPEKGSFCKHFWLAWGMSISRAAQMASGGANSDEIVGLQLKDSSGRDVNEIRNLDEILPEEYSVSYRRLVLRDFTDEEGVADYTIRNATKTQKKQNEGLFGLLTRVNMTRDGMDDDEDSVLPVNFTAVGCILLEFVNALSYHMGWNAIIDESIGQYPEPMRTGRTMGGKKMRPGTFNTSDLNLRFQGLAHMWANMLSRLDVESSDDDITGYMGKATDFAVRFFENVQSERYNFFVETEEKPRSTLSSPLEGSYAYGHTGKSAREPLQAFWILKFNKRGKQAPRVIKPGKRTPFRQSEYGYHADSPYDPAVSQGSKLTRGSSGKYRHIASYSLDELIALGWDGAMYLSKGRHEAQSQYVPYIPGYDSDTDDVYEPIDVQRGKREGTIGLPCEEVGLYMAVPDMSGGVQLVQLKRS